MADGVYAARGPLVPDVRSIAVLRANAVGDFILAEPALSALRAAYPHARITLLGKPWHAEFLAGRPGAVDEVAVMPPIPGVGAASDAPVAADPARIAGFLRAMRERRFDLALQLHGGGRYSNPLVLSLGARVTAGFRTPDAEPLARNFRYIDDQHPVALRMLECVGLVGATLPRIEPRLALRASDLAEAGAAVPDDGRPLAVLNPGATDPRRRWAPAHFARVGDALAARGARVVINAGPQEAETARAVSAAMHAPCATVANGLSLGGLAGLLARAAVLVSNDTGPAHMARALDVPTVTLHWIGNLRAYGPLAAARHRVAVAWRTRCPVCDAESVHHHCGHTASFMDDVTPEAVIALADEVYEPPTAGSLAASSAANA